MRTYSPFHIEDCWAIEPLYLLTSGIAKDQCDVNKKSITLHRERTKENNRHTSFDRLLRPDILEPYPIFESWVLTRLPPHHYCLQSAPSALPPLWRHLPPSEFGTCRKRRCPAVWTRIRSNPPSRPYLRTECFPLRYPIHFEDSAKRELGRISVRATSNLRSFEVDALTGYHAEGFALQACFSVIELIAVSSSHTVPMLSGSPMVQPDS